MINIIKLRTVLQLVNDNPHTTKFIIGKQFKGVWSTISQYLTYCEENKLIKKVAFKGKMIRYHYRMTANGIALLKIMNKVLL